MFLSSNYKVAPLLLNIADLGFEVSRSILNHSPDSGPDYSWDHNWDYSLGGEQEHSWDHKLEHRPARKGTL